MINCTDTNLDYLVIGHVTYDVHKGRLTLGGTASYAAFCAQALGRKPAILTSGAAGEIPLELKDFKVEWKIAEYTTTFENIETDQGRKQILHEIANTINKADVPPNWTNPSIVHLGPVANEVDFQIIDLFPNSFIGVTPQGWFRSRGKDKMVHFQPWEHADTVLERANAVVLSIEDVRGDEHLIQTYAEKTKVLVITEAFNGARVYWNGDVRHFSAPNIVVLDPTGAGDIFATAFFDKLEKTQDPWESAKFSVKVASNSVKREGLGGIPTPEELHSFQIEIIEGI